MRILGAAAFASALAAAPAPAARAGEGWTVFAPPGGGFRIEVPGTPRRESEQRFTPVGSVRETKYWLEVDGAELAVETHDVPPLAAALMSDATILDQARDGVVDNEGGELIQTRALTVQGAPAREFTYRYPGEPVRLERVLTVLMGSRIYLITGTCAEPAAHPAVARFFASFRLARGGAPSAE